METRESVPVPLRLHRVLLALAGRIDDTALTKAREFAARARPGDAAELATGTLAAGRIPVREAERGELAELLATTGGDAGLAELLTVNEAGADIDGMHRFSSADHPEAGIAEVLDPAVAAMPFVRSVHAVWRTTAAGTAPGPLPQRMVLVEVDSLDSAPATACALGSVLLPRAGLDAVVEVGCADSPWTAYHRAALAWAEPVMAGQPEVANAPEPAAPPPPVEPDLEPAPAPAQRFDPESIPGPAPAQRFDSEPSQDPIPEPAVEPDPGPATMPAMPPAQRSEPELEQRLEPDPEALEQDQIPEPASPAFDWRPWGFSEPAAEQPVAEQPEPPKTRPQPGEMFWPTAEPTDSATYEGQVEAGEEGEEPQAEAPARQVVQLPESERAEELSERDRELLRELHVELARREREQAQNDHLNADESSHWR